MDWIARSLELCGTGLADPTRVGPGNLALQKLDDVGSIGNEAWVGVRSETGNAGSVHLSASVNAFHVGGSSIHGRATAVHGGRRFSKSRIHELAWREQKCPVRGHVGGGNVRDQEVAADEPEGAAI
jgi:hypothetical protein